MKKPKPDSWWKKFLVPILVTTIVIPSVALAWNHVKEVWATPTEIKQVKQDQAELRKQSIRQGDWIDQSIKETDMRKKAPNGFRYEESIGEYVEWKDDPRLKKK